MYSATIMLRLTNEIGDNALRPYTVCFKSSWAFALVFILIFIHRVDLKALFWHYFTSGWIYNTQETVTDSFIFLFWNSFKRSDAQNNIYIYIYYRLSFCQNIFEICLLFTLFKQQSRCNSPHLQWNHLLYMEVCFGGYTDRVWIMSLSWKYVWITFINQDGSKTVMSILSLVRSVRGSAVFFYTYI